MKNFFRKDLLGFKAKTIRTLFLIGLFISLVLTPLYIIIVNNYTERKIETTGVITIGTVLGFEIIKKRLPKAVYQFSLDDKVYYGKSDFHYSDSLAAGDSIKIKYIVDKPHLNKIYIDVK